MPTFTSRVEVPYRPDQLFDLVADVDKYPEFLPWCGGARVHTRSDAELLADLTIRFGPFHETFASRVSLERPHRIRARYENGPFRYLNNQWVFSSRPIGTQVDFWVDFEFRNRILQAAIGAVFSEAVKRMVSAFIKRARDVYGAPSPAQIVGQAADPAALRS
jgi:coenzyme Q-binding protein COQ10